MKTSLLQHLQGALSEITNTTVQIINCKQVFGGDINVTYVLFTSAGNYFVKCNNIAYAAMLEKEKDGLQLLRTANTHLKIPKPLLHGSHEQESYLLMEYVAKGSESKWLWQQLGIGLAQLHQHTNAKFGLNYNNYIGTIPQSNKPMDNWAIFYANERILPLMQQACDKQQCTINDVRLAEQFCTQLPHLMPDESPALLHGDLWSGNCMCTAKSEAAIYDPAVYYGHREMDIAMTLLFGGFNAEFYAAYNEVFPLQAGWQSRVAINQLYPLLVHLLLFGGQYYARVKSILNKYV